MWDFGEGARGKRACGEGWIGVRGRVSEGAVLWKGGGAGVMEGPSLAGKGVLSLMRLNSEMIGIAGERKSGKMGKGDEMLGLKDGRVWDC